MEHTPAPLQIQYRRKRPIGLLDKALKEGANPPTTLPEGEVSFGAPELVSFLLL